MEKTRHINKLQNPQIILILRKENKKKEQPHGSVVPCILSSCSPVTGDRETNRQPCKGGAKPVLQTHFRPVGCHHPSFHALQPIPSYKRFWVHLTHIFTKSVSLQGQKLLKSLLLPELEEFDEPYLGN